MDYVLIVFSSLTTANKMNSELTKKFSVNGKVMQTPKGIPLKSCSYCIKLPAANAKTYWEFIKSYNVFTKGMYLERNLTKII